jgi:hypothetical protein
MAHQAPELRRALAESPIMERCFDHPLPVYSLDEYRQSAGSILVQASSKGA